MKVTIEEIMFFHPEKEKHIYVQHTIIWHDKNYFRYEYYCGNYNKPSAKIQDTKRLCKVITDNSVILFEENHDFSPNLNRHIATALPPLPRNPTADDAKLLYDYEAHGLCLVGDVEEFCTGEDNDLGNTYRAVHILKYVDSMLPNNVTLLYAINEQNERVEIAIYDRELQK
jgi:hypothetical protein